MSSSEHSGSHPRPSHLLQVTARRSISQHPSSIYVSASRDVIIECVVSAKLLTTVSEPVAFLASYSPVSLRP